MIFTEILYCYISTGLFRLLVDEYKLLPDEKKTKFIAESEKLKPEFFDAMEKWNERITKAGKAEDLAKAKERLKTVKDMKKKVRDFST